MTPFMQFRLWLREGPSTERLLVSIGAVLAVALVGWGLVPDRDGVDDGQAVVAAGPAAAGEAAGPATTVPGAEAPVAGAEAAPTTPGADPTAAAPTGVAGSPSAGPAGGGTVGATGAAKPTSGGRGCDGKATDQGVTGEQILIGVVFPSIGELNPALGIPSPDEHRKVYEELLKRLNAQGGIQCRKVVAKYYEDFVLSPESGRAACLKMQEDKVYAVLNNLFRPESRNCPMQNKIPNFWYTSPDTSVVRQFSPYLMGFQSDYERLIRDYVYAARDLKFFDGMAKLGLLEQTCFPERVAAIRARLAEVGVPKEKISAYNVGCPGTIATPEQATAAAVQFRREGVTHVMSVYREGTSEFAEQAQNQAYKPKYAVMDDQWTSLANNANPPWSENLDGALVISKGQEGAERTPGSVFSQATQDCIALTESLGMTSPIKPGRLDAALYGNACAQVKLFAAAAAATVPLTRVGLAAGLGTVGKVDLSFPAGPSNFRPGRLPLGNHFWRPAAFRAACKCVQITDANYRPEFAG